MTGKITTWKNRNSHVLVNDKTPDSHHGCASIVQLDTALSKLSLFVKFVPPKVQRSVSVVTHKLCLVVEPIRIAVDNFCQNKKEKHLDSNNTATLGLYQGWDSGKTIGDTFSAGKANPGSSYQVSYNGQHGHASVLNLALAEQVELFLVSIGNNPKRIPKSKLYKAQMSHEIGKECKVIFTSRATYRSLNTQSIRKWFVGKSRG